MGAAACSVERPAPGLWVAQPTRGFRYAMDAVLLAAFAAEGGLPDAVVDAGAGSGVVGLLLARAGAARVTLLDVRPEWRAAQEWSIAASGLAGRVEARTGDLRDWAAAPAPLVVMNPPYFSPAAGPVSPDPVRAAARSTLHGTLDALLAALPRVGARVAVVLPAGLEDRAAGVLRAAGAPLRRAVRLPPAFVLLEASLGPPGPVDLRCWPLAPGAPPPPEVRAWYASVGAGGGAVP